MLRWAVLGALCVRGGKAARGRAAARWLRRSARRFAVLPNSLRRAIPRPFIGHACVDAVGVAESPTAGACALFAPQPAHAQLCGSAVAHHARRRGAQGRAAAGRWCTTRSGHPTATPRMVGSRGNKAQAHTVDGHAARTAPVLHRAAMGRKAFQRREFGSSAQRCSERRSHRPATRPCAASPQGGRAHALNVVPPSLRDPTVRGVPHKAAKRLRHPRERRCRAARIAARSGGATTRVPAHFHVWM
jgi:hypothetical protein